MDVPVEEASPLQVGQHIFAQSMIECPPMVLVPRPLLTCEHQAPSDGLHLGLDTQHMLLHPVAERPLQYRTRTSRGTLPLHNTI